MKEIEQLISKYIDNELDAEGQDQLFTVLAANPRARKTLHDFMKINMGAASFYTNVDAKFTTAYDHNIGTKQKSSKLLKQSGQHIYKYISYLSAAATLAILILWRASNPEHPVSIKNVTHVDTVYIHQEDRLVNEERPGSRYNSQCVKKIVSEYRTNTYMNYVNSLKTIKITDSDILKINRGI